MTPEIQIQINEALLYKDHAAAVKILNDLHLAGPLDMSNPDILKLQYIRMMSLAVDQLYELLHTSVLVAYDIEDFDLNMQIQEFFTQHNFVPDEVALCSKIIKSLERSEEILGDKNIMVKSIPVSPELGHWIEDYQLMVGNKKRDVLSLMQYINTAPNIKSISTEQRAVLKNIFELHDYCEKILALWEELPESIEEKDVDRFQREFDWTTLILGLDQQNTADSRQNEEPEPEPQGIEAVQITPVATESNVEIPFWQSQPMQGFPAKITEVDAVRPTPSATLPDQPVPSYEPKLKPQPVQATAVLQPATKPKPAIKLPEEFAANPGLIHDLINKKPKQRMGVIMDPTNVRLEDEQKRLEQSRHAEANAIQAKLAELRKRNKTE